MGGQHADGELPASHVMGLAADLWPYKPCPTVGTTVVRMVTAGATGVAKEKDGARRLQPSADQDIKT
jgi:hypothetical protein